MTMRAVELTFAMATGLPSIQNLDDRLNERSLVAHAGVIAIHANA